MLNPMDQSFSSSAQLLWAAPQHRPSCVSFSDCDDDKHKSNNWRESANNGMCPCDGKIAVGHPEFEKTRTAQKHDCKRPVVEFTDSRVCPDEMDVDTPPTITMSPIQMSAESVIGYTVLPLLMELPSGGASFTHTERSPLLLIETRLC